MTDLIDRLEPRRLFAAVPKPLLSVDGLPRELTAVGETVYFARDSGKDGHLSFPELASYNAKTGQRGSVLRGDGKPFGQYQYTLATDGSRLFISEKHDDGTYEVWAAGPGDRRAWRFSDNSSFSFDDNGSIARSGATTYLRGWGKNGDAIFAVRKAGKPATKLFDSAQIDKKRHINALMIWDGQLTFTMMREGGTVDRVYVTDGTVAGTHQVVVPLKQGTDGFGQVRVAGKNLVVTTPTMWYAPNTTVFYAGDATHGFATYKPPTGATEFSFLGIAGNQAILRTRTNTTTSTGAYSIIATDFTTRGTRTITKAAAGTDLAGVGSNFFTIGDEIYANTAMARDPFDPESIGGYFAPGSFSSGAILNIGGGGASSQPGIHHLDFADGEDRLVLPTASAGRFVDAGGGRAYFITRPSGSTDSSSQDSSAELYLLNSGDDSTMRVSTAFEGPVLAGGKVIYSKTFDDRALREPLVTGGVILGTISRTDQRYALNDRSFQPGGTRVFLDLDRDGTLDKNEPSTVADAGGSYLFDNVKASSKSYAVTVQRFGKWYAKDGWAQEARVRAGHTTVRSFRFEDHKRSSVVTGTLLRGKSSGVAAVKRIDLHLGQYTLSGEVVATVYTDDQGRFRIENLPAGTYTLDFGTSRLASGKDANFTIGVAAELNL